MPRPFPRHTEVALEGPGDEDAVLDVDWLVEPPVLGQALVVLLGRLHRQHDVERVAAQPGQGEHDQAHHPDGQEALQYPSRDVSLHCALAGTGTVVFGFRLPSGSADGTSPMALRASDRGWAAVRRPW